MLNDVAKMSRGLTLLVGVASLLVVTSQSTLAADGGPKSGSAGDSKAKSAATPVTEFTITDGAACDTVHSGDVKLAGKLKINFAGSILPHENTKCVLYGKGVSSLRGKFDQVEVPPGWSYDLTYDDKQPEVVIKNFRPNRPPAFPGAEGFGKYTIGGRGGKVIAVTNLNDDGPGSFRAACDAEGPRTVVFRVSGTIALKNYLKIKNPYITIAGQTAPGDGICIRNYEVEFRTDHVIVRYIRFRPGDDAGVEMDGFGGQGNQAIVDHCSVSWSIDETLSINKAHNFTVQWCMATESLYDSIHKKGHHGYGGLWGGPGGSWHHNILAHHTSRNPRASGNKDSGLMDYRNNVIYNWGFQSAYGGELWPRNWINNYYKSGPGTEDKVKNRIFFQANSHGRMFADGNFVSGFPDITKDNWKGGIQFSPDGDANESTLRVNEPYTVAPVRTQSAEEALEYVLQNAGASLVRDPIDARIANEVRTGTAKYGATWMGGGKGIIDSPKDVGGWPELKSKPAPVDTDGDGMPDDWEVSHGLDPKNKDDGALDRDRDGYTNVEEYLNSLVPAIYTS